MKAILKIRKYIIHCDWTLMQFHKEYDGTFFLQVADKHSDDALQLNLEVEDIDRISKLLLREHNKQADVKAEKALKLLEKYEAWEAGIIGDNECWAPEGMASFPRLTSKLWDEMLELQQERNEILGRFKNDDHENE